MPQDPLTQQLVQRSIKPYSEDVAEYDNQQRSEHGAFSMKMVRDAVNEKLMLMKQLEQLGPNAIELFNAHDRVRSGMLSDNLQMTNQRIGAADAGLTPPSGVLGALNGQRTDDIQLPKELPKKR